MINTNDKVVCVDDSPGKGTLDGEYSFPNGYVKRGTVYNVSGTETIDFSNTGPTAAVYITGVPAIHKVYGDETPWEAARFRRVSDIKSENKLKREEPAHTTL